MMKSLISLFFPEEKLAILFYPTIMPRGKIPVLTDCTHSSLSTYDQLTVHYPIPNNELLIFHSFNITKRVRNIWICVIAQSEQGKLQHVMFPRDYSAPYAT